MKHQNYVVIYVSRGNEKFHHETLYWLPKISKWQNFMPNFEEKVEIWICRRGKETKMGGIRACRQGKYILLAREKLGLELELIY